MISNLVCGSNSAVLPVSSTLLVCDNNTDTSPFLLDLDNNKIIKLTSLQYATRSFNPGDGMGAPSNGVNITVSSASIPFTDVTTLTRHFIQYDANTILALSFMRYHNINTDTYTFRVWYNFADAPNNVVTSGVNVTVSQEENILFQSSGSSSLGLVQTSSNASLSAITMTRTNGVKKLHFVINQIVDNVKRTYIYVCDLPSTFSSSITATTTGGKILPITLSEVVYAADITASTTKLILKDKVIDFATLATTAFQIYGVDTSTFTPTSFYRPAGSNVKVSF